MTELPAWRDWAIWTAAERQRLTMAHHSAMPCWTAEREDAGKADCRHASRRRSCWAAIWAAGSTMTWKVEMATLQEVSELAMQRKRWRGTALKTWRDCAQEAKERRNSS